MIVAYTYDGKPVTVDDIEATGAVTLLLKDAIKPNLVQTLDHTPVFVHGGHLQILPMDVTLLWLLNLLSS